MAWFSRLWVKICLLVIVLGLTVGVFALYRLSYSPAGPRVSVTSQPLKFSMELGKAEFQYGENITIKFRLENIGNETITIMRLNPPAWLHGKKTSYQNVHGEAYHLREFHFGFRITDTNGTEVYGMSRGILDYAYDLRIDPGGWVEQTVDWKHDPTGYDFGWHLPRDTFQIRGVFRHILNNGPLYTLETPPITSVIG